MKKKVFTAALALALAMGICGSVYADTDVSLKIDDPVMSVNGEDRTIDAPPVIIESRTFVPVRAIVEALGGEVDWDAETKTAILDSGEDHIEITVNSDTAVLNGEKKDLDVPATVLNDRTMLPLRFIAEGFGFETDWDAETKTIYVSKKDAVEEEPEEEQPISLGEDDELGEDGNIYTNDVLTLTVKDKNGKVLATYDDADITKWFYTDKNGGECSYAVSSGSSCFIKADGTTIALNDTGDSLLGEDGNTYEFITSRTQPYLFVKNEKGEVVEKYTEKKAVQAVFKDADGNEAIYVYSIDEKPNNGIILPDGTKVVLENNYKNIFLGDDDNYYNIYNNWLTTFDEDGEPAKNIYLSEQYSVAKDEKGNKYFAYSNENGEDVIEYPDGSKYILKFKEEKEGSYIYSCTDGNTYTENEETISVTDSKGKTVLTLTYDSTVREYKSSSDVYKITYYGADEIVLTKPDGKTTVLTETFG